MEPTEAEDIKKQWQEYTEELYKKCPNDPDNHDDVITHLEPDMLECEVKWQKGNSLNIPGCDSWGWKCCLLSWESAAQSLKRQQSGHPTLPLLPLSFKAPITPTSTMTALDTSAKILQHTLQ